MADPLSCLRAATITIAAWNIIYCLIQFGILGWQAQVVKNIQYDYEGRMLPNTGYIDGFQENFPGLYNIYTETPERRRANAMYVMVFVCLIFAIANLLTSCTLLYAAVRYQRSLVLPWFATSIPLCIMTTVYSVLWWSGNEIFNAQLTMSIFEFVMSVVVNSLTIVVVIVFYARLAGSLRSTRHRGSRRNKNKHVKKIYITAPRERRYDSYQNIHASPVVPYQLPYHHQEPTSRPATVQVPLPMTIPSQSAVPKPTIDVYAPEVQDQVFPWKMTQLEDARRNQRKSQSNKIAELYYQQYPESMSDMPMTMRRQMRSQRESMERRKNKNKINDDSLL